MYRYGKNILKNFKHQQNRTYLRNVEVAKHFSIHSPDRKGSWHSGSKKDCGYYYTSRMLGNVQLTLFPRCYSSSSNTGDGGPKSISRLFSPIPVEAGPEGVNVGEELVGPLEKQKMLQCLNKFYLDPTIKELAKEHGLDEYLFQQVYVSFRKHCMDSKTLPTDLHIILNDIIMGAGHIHNLFPSFMQHSQLVFPHLQCLDDLCMISDLTDPPQWYSEARSINRKIVFHAGPTNSGKTYHAMEQFLQADSGIYCGPLKMLATEVFNKSNARDTPCDLVTGEERRYARPDGESSPHVACTVEMASISTKYDVAIIDEIQMLRDPMRGWAWTRALLGLNAHEVHVCGEEAAVPLLEELAMQTGEEIEVRRYKRLTNLTVETTSLESFSNVQRGDCIVCFNKQDIHYVSRTVEKLGHQVAVIYGGLPPGTKLAQSQKFNDPNHPCKIMVATDAIGMGLNLSIRRIVFYSLIKPVTNDKGEKEMDTISVSQALQIAGRAGRYGTQWEHGYVTTMKADALPTLRRLLSSKPEELNMAGLHPTAEQIELFAYHIPNYTLSNLIDIFVNVCTVDKSLYFMCGMDDFKFLADLIQHVQLPLRSRYVFCCSPINKRMPFVCAMFLKMVRQYSQSEVSSMTWLCRQLKWPFQPPTSLVNLVHLEQVFDVLDLYLWLSYRFPDMFPDWEEVKAIQTELDQLIEDSVSRITKLDKRMSPSMAARPFEVDDLFTVEEHEMTTSGRKARAYDEDDQFAVERTMIPSSRNATDRGKTTVQDRQQLQVEDGPHPYGSSSASSGKTAEIYEKRKTKPNKYRSIIFEDEEDVGVVIPDYPIIKKPGSTVPVSALKSQPRKGRLTQRLLDEGLLSREMLLKLQQEWMTTDPNTNQDEPSNPPASPYKK